MSFTTNAVYITIIALLLSRISFGQNISCKDFKNGTFLLEDNSINYRAQIVREDTLQMEYDVLRNKYSMYSVLWTDDCNYILKLIKTEHKELKDYLKSTLSVQIYATRADTVFYTIKATNANQVSSYYMTKINN